MIIEITPTIVIEHMSLAICIALPWIAINVNSLDYYKRVAVFCLATKLFDIAICLGLFPELFTILISVCGLCLIISGLRIKK
jgi:hypothetical protein